MEKNRIEAYYEIGNSIENTIINYKKWFIQNAEKIETQEISYDILYNPERKKRGINEKLEYKNIAEKHGLEVIEAKYAIGKKDLVENFGTGYQRADWEEAKQLLHHEILSPIYHDSPEMVEFAKLLLSSTWHFRNIMLSEDFGNYSKELEKLISKEAFDKTFVAKNNEGEKLLSLFLDVPTTYLHTANLIISDCKTMEEACNLLKLSTEVLKIKKEGGDIIWEDKKFTLLSILASLPIRSIARFINRGYGIGNMLFEENGNWYINVGLINFAKELRIKHVNSTDEPENKIPGCPVRNTGDIEKMMKKYISIIKIINAKSQNKQS